MTFLYWGSDSSYDVYYDDDDTESKDYGYDEKPGKEYVKKLYPDGYDPHAFVDDEGEFFAAYTDSGDYSFSFPPLAPFTPPSCTPERISEVKAKELRSFSL